MNMFRGALAFCVLVAVAVLACQKEQNTGVTTQTTTSGSAVASVTVTQMIVVPCNPPLSPICPEPCAVKVKVNNTDHKHAKPDRNPIYINPTQSVRWEAKEENPGKQSKAELTTVGIIDKGVNQHNKTGTHTAKKQPSQNGAVWTSNGADFEPCTEHKYFAVVKHTHDDGTTEEKVADPEIEVAGTTSIVTTNTSTTSSTGTH